MLGAVAAVLVLDAAVRGQADALAARCGLSCLDATGLSGAKAAVLESFAVEALGKGATLVLLMVRSGLSLQAMGELNLRVRADFHGARTTYRRIKGGGRGQMIAKAVGFKGDAAPSVLDCTAGLGADAFVLASLGCRVTLLERVAVVRELLRDGLEQARKQEDRALDVILQRMHLAEGDALSHLAGMDAATAPEVVYLDPMFPPRSKSALVKKEMRVFHELVGIDADAHELLPAALSVARKRVVVKRPRIAPALTGVRPSHVLEGKRNRYDIYVVN